MSERRIFGICLVKNEDDIIEQSLTFAAAYCERIYVLDNGSTDDTWEIVLDLARKHTKIVPFEQTFEPYGDWLRAKVFNAVHRELSDNDWWLILDSDEFLAEDPRPVLKAAVVESADVVSTWQIQFYFTDKDLAAWEQGKDPRNAPIFNRRRYYLINWQEPRFFRNRSRQEWDARTSIKIPDGLQGVCRRRVLNRHYQFRDPDQIQKRLNLRHGHSLFPHVRSSEWRDTVRNSRTLNFYSDGDPWRFSPSGLLYFYRRMWRPVVSEAVGAVGNHLRSPYYDGAIRRIKRLVTRNDG